MTRTSISLTAPSLGDGKELVGMDSHLSWSMPWVNEYGPDVHVYIRCNVTRFYMTNVGGSGRENRTCNFSITNFVDFLASHSRTFK